MRLLQVFSALLFLSVLSCVPETVHGDTLVSRFSSAAAWRWQGTDCFVLRGRARLQGESQVFSGPFMVVGSTSSSLLRGDFCGPDGAPVVSFRGDSTGFLLYYPGGAEAFYSVGGIPVEDGLLSVNALLSTIRTGYPGRVEAWKMEETAVTDHNSAEWSFVASGNDTLRCTLGQGSLFPVISAGGTSLRITATSWHDSFNAWPLEWILESPSTNLIVRISSIDQPDSPGENNWDLSVPVPVDTVYTPGGEWRNTVQLPIR